MDPRFPNLGEGPTWCTAGPSFARWGDLVRAVAKGTTEKSQPTPAREAGQGLLGAPENTPFSKADTRVKSSYWPPDSPPPHCRSEHTAKAMATGHSRKETLSLTCLSPIIGPTDCPT